MKFICAALMLLVSSAASAGINNPGSGGSSGSIVGQTVANDTGSGLMFLNLAHGISITSTQVGWPGALTSDGYPTGTTTQSFTNNNLPFIPTYYGHYKCWWVGTAAGFAVQGGASAIIYNGGAAVSGLGGSNTGSTFNNTTFGNGSGAGQQPTSSTPIEFALGALITAVGTDSSTGPTLVKFTAGTNAFANINTGTNYQFNNLTGLPTGPNSDGSWTINNIDNQNISLQGSTAQAGSVSINTSGTVGVNTEAIQNGANFTWAMPAGTYTGFSGLVIARNSDVAAINAGHYINPDYVTAWKSPNLNPRFIRFMDLVRPQYNFSTSYANRPVTTHLSWGQANNVSAYWGGNVTNGGSDNYTLASNPSASPASGAFVDGEVVSGVIVTTNTTLSPTLAITGRTGSAPILGIAGALRSLTMSGSVPGTGAVISLVFTGGGLSVAFTYNYTTVAGDSSFSAIASHIISDLNNNTSGHSGALVTAQIVAANPEVSGAQITFRYNPNINSSGVAALGNGLTITGSDSGSSGVYSFGYVPVGYLTNNFLFSFTYSTILGGWITTPGSSSNGLSTGNMSGGAPFGGPPLEFYEDFVKQANVGMLLNIPVLQSDASITSTVTNIANSGVRELALEISNETWNQGNGGQWHVFDSFGTALGLQSSFVGGPSVDAYTGLRIIQMATVARAAWVAAGRVPGQLYINNAYQFVAPNTAQRFNGGALTPGSNVTLAAYGGSPSNGTVTPTAWATNSSTFPNRPIDWSDDVSPAPYFQGVQFNTSFGGALQTGSGINLASYNCSLVASYNYVNGNASQQAAAINFLFNGTSGDFYSLTTLSGGSYTSGTAGFALAAFAHGSGVSGAADYYGITSIVAGYDSVRTGTNPHTSVPWNILGVIAYEGDAQAGPVTNSDATTIATSLTNLGDTSGYTSGLGASCGMTPAVGGPTSTASSDSTNMQILLNGNGTTLPGFKGSSQYQQLYLQYFNDFKTAINSQGTRLAIPATYGFEGSGSSPGGTSWAKYPGSIYTTPFQSWNAIRSFN